MTPLIIVYLFMIDFLYMALSLCIKLPLLILISIGVIENKRLIFFDTVIESTMSTLFRMKRMDVLGFRRQRTVL